MVKVLSCMSMPFFNQSKYSCKASELVYSSQSGNLCCGFFRLGPQLQWLGREASLDRWNWHKFFLAKTDFMRVKSWNPSRETQSSGQKGVERDERNKRNKTSNKSTVGAVFVRGVWDSKSSNDDLIWLWSSNTPQQTIYQSWISATISQVLFF